MGDDRGHLAVEPEYHQKVREISLLEGRSMKDITQEMIDRYTRTALKQEPIQSHQKGQESKDQEPEPENKQEGANLTL